MVVAVPAAVTSEGATSAGSGTGILAAMPGDDPFDEDGARFGRPLPPEDRLWRHPSELGLGGAMAGAAHPSRRAGVPPSHAAGGRRRSKTLLVAAGSAFAGAAATLAGVAVVAVAVGDDQPAPTPVIERVEPPHAVSALDGGALETTLSRQVIPAVARVEVTRARGRNTGTAITFRSDGHLLTSADLVQDAEAVTVTLADGRVLPATVIGADEVTDIAVVKVEASDLPTALLGSARDLQLGEPAFALDAGPGATRVPTVTGGVISGLGEHVAPVGGEPLHDLIATNTGSDTASPGAALVDSSGALIGIATARRPPESMPVATGTPLARYATPIEYARQVADELLSEGRAQHVWLGVEGRDLSRREANGLSLAGGAVVETVQAGGPAGGAGLVPDDIITAVDDVRVTDMSSLVVSLRPHRPGSTVSLEVRRGDETLVLEVTLAERPTFP